MHAITTAVRAITTAVHSHPLISYVVVTFAVSWSSALAVTGGAPPTTQQIPVLGVAMLAGPGVAAVTLTGWVAGRAGLRDLWSRLTRWRVEMRWYAFALLACPVSTAAVLVALSCFSSAFTPLPASRDDWPVLVGAGLAAGLLVGLLEELGWTGFAVPRLLAGHGPLAVGLLVGALWGAWHFIVFREADTFSAPFPLVLLLARLFTGLLALRVMLVWLHVRTQSLFLPVLMHAVVVAGVIALEPVLAGRDLLVFVLLRSAVWAALALVVLRLAAPALPHDTAIGPEVPA
jgi:membrane protease YdiL (CAAX protease family)